VELALVARKSAGRPPKATNQVCACGAVNQAQRATCRKCGVQLRERRRAPKKTRGKEVMAGEGSEGE